MENIDLDEWYVKLTEGYVLARSEYFPNNIAIVSPENIIYDVRGRIELRDVYVWEREGIYYEKVISPLESIALFYT